MAPAKEVKSKSLEMRGGGSPITVAEVNEIVKKLWWLSRWGG